MKKVRLLVDFVINNKRHKKGSVVAMKSEEAFQRSEIGEVEILDPNQELHKIVTPSEEKDGH